jgi:hypothetical protein
MENERAAPDVSFPKLFEVSRLELEYLKMTAIVRKLHTRTHDKAKQTYTGQSKRTNKRDTTFEKMRWALPMKLC